MKVPLEISHVFNHQNEQITIILIILVDFFKKNLIKYSTSYR
jgi:hypothetical protein